MRQQCDQPNPHAIADTHSHACANSIPDPNPFADTCTYTYSNPTCDSYSENYSHPDSLPCDSGVVGPI